MATPDPSHPTSGKWTFVNSKGEEEDVDEAVSTTSSSDSSEFVKVDGQGVSYHHGARATSESTSDSELSSLGEDEAACSPRLQNSEVKKKEDGNKSDATSSQVTSDTRATVSSEDDSDVEVLPPGESFGRSPVDEVKCERLQGSAVEQPRSLPTGGCTEPGPVLSRQTSEESGLQFRLVLLPRSLSATDSDSDFSHLDTHSSADQSESEELSDPADHTTAPALLQDFSFVQQATPDVEVDLPIQHRGDVQNDWSEALPLDLSLRSDHVQENVPVCTDGDVQDAPHVHLSDSGQPCDGLATGNHGQLKNIGGGDGQGGIDETLAGDSRVQAGNDEALLNDDRVDAGYQGGIDEALADGNRVMAGHQGGIDEALPNDDDVEAGYQGGIDEALPDGNEIEEALQGRIDEALPGGNGIEAGHQGGIDDALPGDNGIDVGHQGGNAGLGVNDAAHGMEDEGFDDHDVDDGAAPGDPDDEDHRSDIDDADTGTESGVEDDRIESDQSDSLPADEDDDLSFSNIGLENISLHEVNRSRQYIHEPNKCLSGTLSLVVIMAGWVALGLGIGHSIGSASQNAYVHSLNEASTAHTIKLHQTQDNLFLCLHRKADVLSMLTRERRDWDYLKTELTDEMLSRKATIDRLSAEMEGWKIKVNELQQAKADLEVEVGRLKYRQHPGNDKNDIAVAGSSSAGQVADNKTSLNNPDSEPDWPRAVENLKVDRHEEPSELLGVGKEDNVAAEESEEQPSSDPLPTEEWENQTAKLRQELSLAQGRAAMWQQLYLTERSRKPADNTTLPAPDVLSCLTMLTPKVNFSEVVRALNNTIVNSLKDFPNISQIRGYINDSLESKRIFSTFAEFRALFEELSDLWMKWGVHEHTGSSSQSGWDFESEQRSGEEGSRWNGGQEGSSKKPYPWSENLKQFLNETQESVSRVSKEIQEKWKQMKNLSEDLWKKHQPTINDWQNNISKQISNIGSRIKDKLQQKSNCWFNRKGKRCHKSKKHHSGKSPHNDRREQDERGNSKRWERKSHNDRDKRKKREADTGRRGRDHEGKNFKKSLKKLAKTIKRLSWKSFKHLGLDGMGRIIAELDGFLGFLHRQGISDGKANKWLSCQLEWWNTQLLKKPFALDGCRRSLFKWQVKIETKSHKWSGEQESQKGGCKTKTEKMRKGKFRHGGDRKNKPRGDKRKFHKEKGRRKEASGKFGRTKRREHEKRQQDLPKADHGKKQRKKEWDSSKSRNRTEDGGMTVSGDWYFKPPRYSGSDESWYIRKMEQRKKERESDVYDAGWVFQRADDRDFNRKRPDDWYFRRTREKRRGTYPPRKPHPNYEHEENDDYGQEYYSYGFSACCY